MYWEKASMWISLKLSQNYLSFLELLFFKKKLNFYYVMGSDSLIFSLIHSDYFIKCSATCHIASFNSIQFILYSPISQITNVPQRALQSVHIRHPWPLTSHRIRRNSPKNWKNPFTGRERKEETFRRATEEDPSPGWTEAIDSHVTRWTIDVMWSEWSVTELLHIQWTVSIKRCPPFLNMLSDPSSSLYEHSASSLWFSNASPIPEWSLGRTADVISAPAVVMSAAPVCDQSG